MKVLKLAGKQNTSKIMIEKGILREAAEFCRTKSTVAAPSKICVITDSNVAGLYLKELEKRLSDLNIPLFHHIVSAGEEHKNLETVSRIYDALSEHNFGRDDMIIALGGGVTGDIAGFAAATYLRGIRHLIQIPTTLLAQVDSSVGGKTGVDLPQGKNLVGAFRQPDLVLIDPELLDTLPENVYRSGMAEVIKYGCISDPELLELAFKTDHKKHAKEEDKDRIMELIERCVRIKIKVVEADETEEGLRRILNFGHTIGHGVEKLGNFTKLSHGEAVAIGMAAAVKIGESIGITRDGCYEKLVSILQSFSLPSGLTDPVDKVYGAMLSDKKKQGDGIHFVLIEEFGKAQVKKIPVAELKNMMKVLGD
ncbi:MAG: 3-dehydroquinate synthase [Eubacteriales bacterium]|nr:3-dehydroquinate synthase [Eubacteriales bacterium]